MQTTVEQEKNYNILKNAAGDLMILIRARLDDATHPRVIYSGGKHAVLYRSSEKALVLDFIHPSVREDLNRTSRVLIVEARDGAVIREYTSEVKHLKDVPLPNDLILN